MADMAGNVAVEGASPAAAFASGAMHFFIGEDALGAQRRIRSRSMPTKPARPRRPARLHGPNGDGADIRDCFSEAAESLLDEEQGCETPERMQLLWALWEAQQAASQEEEMIQQAESAQSDLRMQNEAKRQELCELEAELAEARALMPQLQLVAESGVVGSGYDSGRPSPSASTMLGGRLDSVCDPGGAQRDASTAEEIECLRSANDALHAALKEVEGKLRDAAVLSSAMQNEELSDRFERVPKNGALATGTEIETFESELAQLRRQELSRDEKHRKRIGELRAEFRDAEEAECGTQRRALRQELVEIYAEREVLESELEGSLRAQAVAVKRLTEEEQFLSERLREVVGEDGGGVLAASQGRSRSESLTTFESGQSSGFDIAGVGEQLGGSRDVRGSLLDELLSSPQSRHWARSVRLGADDVGSDTEESLHPSADECSLLTSVPVRSSVARRLRQRSSLSSAVTAYRSPGFLCELRKRHVGLNTLGPDVVALEEGVMIGELTDDPAVEVGRGGPSSDDKSDELRTLQRRAVEAGLLFSDARRSNAAELIAWLRQLEDRGRSCLFHLKTR
mmetsp:Transcript_122150/g.353182  ORF Transcript_122150/g.353182 Transcript_122150/m.353182 type:complete len:569 (+) Transcript_122150:46-1752(+)